VLVRHRRSLFCFSHAVTMPDENKACNRTNANLFTARRRPFCRPLFDSDPMEE
jgi:hypothetical protein